LVRGHKSLIVLVQLPSKFFLTEFFVVTLIQALEHLTFTECIFWKDFRLLAGSIWLKIFNCSFYLTKVGMGSSISSVGDMFGLDCFTGGLGDLVVDIGTGNLGDSVAVLNLNWDKLDLGVINAVLSGNFTASMLDISFDGVSNSMGSNWSNMSNWGCKRSSSKRGSIRMGKELRISFSFSLTLSNVMRSKRGSNRSITDGVNNFLAEL